MGRQVGLYVRERTSEPMEAASVIYEVKQKS